MKIAIIGAGISGLSCAYELSRLGLSPVIFEKTRQLGDKPGNLVAILRLFQNTLSSPMDHILKHYGLNISPLHPLKEMVVNTPNRTIRTKANHGYVFAKGLQEYSLEHQIASHAELKIIFESCVDIRTVKNEFDYVVVATGNGDIARELGIWNTSFRSGVRIATVSGNFQANTMTMWLNKKYSRNGYGYLIPKNPREAELALAVSDVDKNDVDFYWKIFLKEEKLNYKMLKINDINHQLGYPDFVKYDNLYFAGNSGGMMDNFLGFGVIRSIKSGILAARAIAGNLDYAGLLKPYIKEVNQLNAYREMINVLTNRDYDMDLSILGLPGIKHLVYNNPLYKAKFGLLAPKLIYTYKTYKNKLHSKRPDT